jgi:hypothetical protein
MRPHGNRRDEKGFLPWCVVTTRVEPSFLN